MSRVFLLQACRTSFKPMQLHCTDPLLCWSACGILRNGTCSPSFTTAVTICLAIADEIPVGFERTWSAKLMETN